MERLEGQERAAFLLHDVFDTDYADIAAILGKSEVACRQMVSRARRHVRENRPRAQVAREQVRGLLDRFMHAVQHQDQRELLELFDEQATWTADGGGKARAALKVVSGREHVVRFVLGVIGRHVDKYSFERTTINGEPGILLIVEGQTIAALSVKSDGERIQQVFSILNPDKLRGDSNFLSQPSASDVLSSDKTLKHSEKSWKAESTTSSTPKNLLN
jgi:RNA polymerase sigma-70 factor (ECF subfamily)